MQTRNSSSRCKGRTKSGKPCRAAATAGGLCYFHANPAKARELGRIGGRKNRRSGMDHSDAFHVPAEHDARLEQLLQGVASGQIAPDKARVMLAIDDRIFERKEHRDLVERVAALEKISQKRSQSDFEEERSGTATPSDDSEEEPTE